jgi:hypothetical protein
VKNVGPMFVQYWRLANLEQIFSGGGSCGFVAQLDREVI